MDKTEQAFIFPEVLTSALVSGLSHKTIKFIELL